MRAQPSSSRCFLSLLVAFLTGCVATPEEPSTTEGAATSAQDPAVAKLRLAFARASIASVASLGTTSATGMTTTWTHCTERSARRNDTTTAEVDYILTGSGEDVVNHGTGFGKLFLPDATQESGPVHRREAIGYPAGIVGTPHVTLDVARIAENGDLLIERILKPAASDTTPPLEETARTEYEHAVYEDPRAFAVAYVRCAAADRQRSGGGTSGVVYYDDCKDRAFTEANWNGEGRPVDACAERAWMLLPTTTGTSIEVDFGSKTVGIGFAGAWVGVKPSLGTVTLGQSSWSGTTVTLPDSATSVRMTVSGGKVKVYAGATYLGQLERTDTRQLELQPFGRLSSIKVW